MGQAPIHYIRLRTFSYTTEVRDRVEKALSFFLFEDDEIKTEQIEGNFGNQYWLLKSKIERSQKIRKLVSYIRENLSDKKIRKIKKELDERINEECSFYLRFDKQKAYKNTLKLTTKGNSIVLRFKVKAYPAKKKKAIKTMKEFL